MKRFQKLVAVMIIVGLLLSLVCVCSLYAYPSHTHKNNEAHCVLCAIAEHAAVLLHSPRAMVGTGLLLLLLLLSLATMHAAQTRQAARKLSPITLRTKLNT